MMAAWQVRPPRLVTMAEAIFITGSQFGSVMSVTSTSPFFTLDICAAPLTTRTAPVPILWPMARPLTSTRPFAFSRKRSSTSPPARDFTVSGRACRM